MLEGRAEVTPNDNNTKIVYFDIHNQDLDDYDDSEENDREQDPEIYDMKRYLKKKRLLSSKIGKLKFVRYYMQKPEIKKRRKREKKAVIKQRQQEEEKNKLNSNLIQSGEPVENDSSNSLPLNPVVEHPESLKDIKLPLMQENQISSQAQANLIPPQIEKNEPGSGMNINQEPKQMLISQDPHELSKHNELPPQAENQQPAIPQIPIQNQQPILIIPHTSDVMMSSNIAPGPLIPSSLPIPVNNQIPHNPFQRPAKLDMSSIPKEPISPLTKTPNFPHLRTMFDGQDPQLINHNFQNSSMQLLANPIDPQMAMNSLGMPHGLPVDQHQVYHPEVPIHAPLHVSCTNAKINLERSIPEFSRSK